MLIWFRRIYVAWCMSAQRKIIAQAEFSLSHQIMSLSDQKNTALARLEALRREYDSLFTNPL